MPSPDQTVTSWPLSIPPLLSDPSTHQCRLPKARHLLLLNLLRSCHPSRNRASICKRNRDHTMPQLERCRLLSSTQNFLIHPTSFGLEARHDPVFCPLLPLLLGSLHPGATVMSCGAREHITCSPHSKDVPGPTPSMSLLRLLTRLPWLQPEQQLAFFLPFFALFCSDSTRCLWVCLSFHNGKDLVHLGHIARWAWFRFSVQMCAWRQMVAWFISVLLSVHNM